MFRKILIANRGEIAVRIQRTLRAMGIASVAVTSDADRFTRGVLDADEAVRLGPAPAAQSYLRADAIVAACRATGAEAVHPGYGFLSENAAFAEALGAAGIAFIGPRPKHLRAFGLKHSALALAREHGVPLLPGSGLLETIEEALIAAAGVGYPVILKSTAGGGGIGMQICRDADELTAKFDAVRRTAAAGFGDARVFLERYVTRARHVEVQIFGDGKGRVVALGERDCSLQRRNQKVFEETPAPNFPPAVRRRMHDAAIKLGAAVAYESAGTVEFIYDEAAEDFFFLEVNTRLQVEHPVTEAVFGIDLVECMIRQAAGEPVIERLTGLTPSGAAIEARLYAESPHANFAPSTGRVTEVVWPEGARIDGWIEAGSEVTPFYDPLLAKIIVHGATRPEAIARLRAALGATRIGGLETNLDYLATIAATDAFAAGAVATSVLPQFAYQPASIDVLAGGAQTSIQDLPGRLGLWHVGVPPSGPMDSRSLRAANRCVGNPEGAPALEMTLAGPTLRFNAPALIALAGADMGATLDGAAVALNMPIPVAAGQTLLVGRADGAGLRAYLAVRGGFDVPVVLGSRATFAAGKFGGHATGVLKTGDVLRFGKDSAPLAEPRALAAGEIAPLAQDWTIGVLYGPHGAPDFFTEHDIETLFTALYTVHFNSDRTGVRLIGPRPEWARRDGGEAGLHPSNIHDNAYAVGSIDFTGDMPIILGPDGPSLGGFVCPAVVASDELWKIGQLRPGDTIRFVAAARPDHPVPAGARDVRGPAVLRRAEKDGISICYRRAGDENLLVEYGPMALDIALRLRVHLLHQALIAAALPGIVDLTPGIRSLQVHYDPARLSCAALLAALAELEAGLPAVEDARIPNRIVHLPLSWNDPQIVLAMRKYQELVRPDAPWCPDNIEFIRRINGLESVDAVRDIVFAADFLVLGLGDVYLGAPVATPLDPRHRMVTTKYNPARTWTPENAVGIGGAYLCIYGMEGPGGYQLFGRTIQMWNTWRATPPFEAGSPWLLRFFDQIRFFPVSEAELEDARAAFPHGAYPIRIEESVFDYRAYAAMLKREETDIAAFKLRQQTAFEAERRRWRESGLDTFVSEAPAAPLAAAPVPDGCLAVEAQVTGNVWKILAEPGAQVAAGETIVIVESMKMELAIAAPLAGTVRELRTRPGQLVQRGDIVAVLAPG
jgi:urea carboxylase